MIGPQGTAGFGDFHNRIREHGRFYFCRAPGKFNLHIHAMFLEVVFGYIDQFSGNDLALKILRLLERRTLRRSQYPTHFAATLLGVNQIGNSDDFQSAFNHPVETSEASIQCAVLDVASHLLRPN